MPQLPVLRRLFMDLHLTLLDSYSVAGMSAVGVDVVLSVLAIAGVQFEGTLV